MEDEIYSTQVATAPNTRGLLLSLAILLMSLGLLYHHVLARLVHDWFTDSNYSHGFLIPFIAGYLVWQRKHRLSLLPSRPSKWGILLVVAGLAIYTLGYIGSELFSTRFSLIVLIWGLVLFLAGWPWAQELLVPISYLFFMIPLPAIVWNKIAFPLKLFVTRLAVWVTSLLGIPAYRDGNIIHLSNTTLQVVDACSGMRSLASLLALSAAFSFLTSHSVTKKWLLFFSAVPIAIILNVFRLTLTAVLAQAYSPQVAKGFLHEISGLIVFVLAIGLLYGCHLLVKRI